MNLNSIRCEGFWGKDETLYDLCDENGILVMTGWNCHWEWEEYLLKPCDEKYGGPVNDEDINLMAGYWKDQLLWCIDPVEIEKAITPRTKAILPVHLYGSFCDMDAIMKMQKHTTFSLLKIAPIKQEGNGATLILPVLIFLFATESILGNRSVFIIKYLWERKQILT